MLKDVEWIVENSSELYESIVKTSLAFLGNKRKLQGYIRKYNTLAEAAGQKIIPEDKPELFATVFTYSIYKDRVL